MSLADSINALLPQTQCTRCGYADCRAYAEAIAEGEAEINQCPPGGAEGIERLAKATGRAVIPLNPVHGTEGTRHVALIDETWCIGCTLCIKACPVDAIIGASKHMHTVIAERCTGCELCIAPCPVDVISLVNVTGAKSGWDAWSAADADLARTRYETRTARLVREEAAHQASLSARRESDLADLRADDAEAARKREIIAAAMERARLLAEKKP
jgi:Na+-translocating ferredoxin:NAD+ oxidoreductase subunit B